MKSLTWQWSQQRLSLSFIFYGGLQEIKTHRCYSHAHTHMRGAIFCEKRDLRWEGCETHSAVCPAPSGLFCMRQELSAPIHSQHPIVLYSVANRERECDKENFVHCFTSVDTTERPGSFSSWGRRNVIKSLTWQWRQKRFKNFYYMEVLGDKDTEMLQ